MSVKPENQFRSSVHKHLPPALHHEKMSNPYRSGGADDWYSGRNGVQGLPSHDLWIEWKFIVLPKRDDTVIDLVGGKHPTLSALQQHWLRERHLDGRNVWVGVGCKEGGVIFRGGEKVTWETPLTAAQFRGRLVSRAELAQTITNFVEGR